MVPSDEFCCSSGDIISVDFANHFVLAEVDCLAVAVSCVPPVLAPFRDDLSFIFSDTGLKTNNKSYK